MRTIFIKLLFAGLLFAGYTQTTSASLIEYSFEGEYQDGSTAAGTFNFDDVSKVYSSALINLVGGAEFSDSIFNFIHVTTDHAIVLLDSNDGPAYDNDNIFHIILQDNELFGNLLPTSVYSDIALCDKDDCPARDNLKIATSTSLTGKIIRGVVPEPSIIALFAAGLFGIGIARRRNQ